MQVMQIHLEPNLEKELNELAAQIGRTADELVQDAVAGLVEDLRETRDTLDSRYDDIKSGRVRLLPGDQVIARLRARSAARRLQSRS
jgi:predicted transcriptional regulator